ncbi:MAG TPA: glycosyltransferase family A protein [Solirubrobacterales bacterium]|nr:glycosyltransferase family A protein [Solirubrobacterales bacterium]
MIEIAVLIPTLGRAGLLEGLLHNLAEATPRHYCNPVFVLDRDDQESLEVVEELYRRPGQLLSWIISDGTYPQKINAGLRATVEPFVLPTADDVRFYEGWLEAVTTAFEDERVQVVGTDDLSPSTANRDHATMPILRRSYIESPGAVWGEIGTVFHEGYRHNFCETELWQLAVRRGVTAWAEGAVIEHLHPAWGKRAEDATDEKGNKQGWEEDEARFRSRMAEWCRRA